jgi:hypothetical protein
MLTIFKSEFSQIGNHDNRNLNLSGKRNCSFAVFSISIPEIINDLVLEG